MRTLLTVALPQEKAAAIQREAARRGLPIHRIHQEALLRAIEQFAPYEEAPDRAGGTQPELPVTTASHPKELQIA
jgi:hypothetical protein